MSIYNKIHEYEKQNSMTLRLLVSDMVTIEDYNIISEKLKKHEGIKDIFPFTNNTVIKIVFFSSIIDSQTIYYSIVKLGYRLGLKNENIYKPERKKKSG